MGMGSTSSKSTSGRRELPSVTGDPDFATFKKDIATAEEQLLVVTQMQVQTAEAMLNFIDRYVVLQGQAKLLDAKRGTREAGDLVLTLGRKLTSASMASRYVTISKASALLRKHTNKLPATIEGLYEVAKEVKRDPDRGAEILKTIPISPNSSVKEVKQAVASLKNGATKKAQRATGTETRIGFLVNDSSKDSFYGVLAKWLVQEKANQSEEFPRLTGSLVELTLLAQSVRELVGHEKYDSDWSVWFGDRIIV